ncbi:MAG: M23 family metallopeptidase [Deltaproteobacteria bacterium]|nr:M23 family metallopeptidase [Deltaproteobacteria bacterium]
MVWWCGIRKIFPILLVACAALAGCSSSQLHTVRRGETLSEIAERYNLSSSDLARHNGIADPDQLEIGQELRLPSGAPRSRRAAEVRSARRFGATDKREARRSATAKRLRARSVPEPADDVPGDVRRFPREREPETGEIFSHWPITGRLASRFGPRGGSFHDGIDITAPTGTPISAVADGEVIFSNVLHGYGNIVLIRHRNGLVSVYAHNRRNLVKEGEWVRRGKVIAEVGQTGRASGPHLHFEIRKDNQARNPLRYLPGETRTASRER